MSPVSVQGDIQLRDNLDNCRSRFEQRHRGNVAFLGGSITEMEGYRPLIEEFLSQRFPETVFKFTNAGISSTCSNTGAFRLQRDVLDHGPVDLLFVEFAVNDDQDGHFSRAECIRGMEGIIRQARLKNPNLDIVMMFFVNEAMIAAYQQGGVPLSIQAHESVAQTYSIPTINVARQLSQQITAGTMTWKKYGGTHPGPEGARFCAQMAEALLSEAWRAPLPSGNLPRAHALPAEPLDAQSYFSGRFIPLDQAIVKNGWSLNIPDWKALRGATRKAFVSIPMLSATEAGSELDLPFKGTAVGAYIVSGPDAGYVEARIDEGPAHVINLSVNHSAALHYPWTVMFGAGLSPGDHVLSLRIAAESKTGGHAMRIMDFTAN